MKFQILLIFSALCASVFGQNTIAYSAQNVSVNNANGEFNFRATSLSAFGFLGFNGVNYASLTANANQNNANVNGVFGAVYTSLAQPPCAYMSFFDIAATFSFTQNSAQANVTGAGAFIGNAYLSLEEVNTGGNVVNTVALSSLVFTLDNGASSLGNGGLRYAVLRGRNVIPNSFEVVLTFVVSDVIGALNVAGTPIITPKTMEIVVNINNYPYQNVANALRLNIGVATGVGAVSGNGLVTGSGLNSAYIQFGTVANINGVPQAVTVSGFTDVSASVALNNINLEAQVTAKYGGQATFKIVSVTFPAGATAIEYDPSLGVGSVPTSPAGIFVPSVILSLLAFLFLLA